MTTRRLIVAGLSAMAGLLLVSPGASAESRVHGNSQPSQTAAAAAASPSSDRDVPGAAVDPSRKDHDNGIGNNCDPGFGRGNQSKFGMAGQAGDSGETACTKKRSSEDESRPELDTENGAVAAAESPATQPAESNASVAGAVSANRAAVPASMNTGDVLANTALAPGPGGALAAAVAPTVQAATGAVLAATGTPVVLLLLGLVLLVGGLVLARTRARL